METVKNHTGKHPAPQPAYTHEPPFRLSSIHPLCPSQPSTKQQFTSVLILYALVLALTV